jgi:hypothetical protein
MFFLSFLPEKDSMWDDKYNIFTHIYKIGNAFIPGLFHYLCWKGLFSVQKWAFALCSNGLSGKNFMFLAPCKNSLKSEVLPENYKLKKHFQSFGSTLSPSSVSL